MATEYRAGYLDLYESGELAERVRATSSSATAIAETIRFLTTTYEVGSEALTAFDCSVELTITSILCRLSFAGQAVYSTLSLLMPQPQPRL
jgi:hypothetical protein